MKILLIDERKTRREEFGSFNKEVNELLNHCDELHIPTGNECHSFLDKLRSETIFPELTEYDVICCHHTFVEEVEDRLKHFCRKHHLPLIFFSGRYSCSYLNDGLLQLSVDKFYLQALPAIVEEVKAGNPLLLEKIEFGRRYELALLMNTRNLLAEWLENEYACQDYSELNLNDAMLSSIGCASLTECVREEKEYAPSLLREQIDHLSHLIRRKL